MIGIPREKYLQGVVHVENRRLIGLVGKWWQSAMLHYPQDPLCTSRLNTTEINRRHLQR